MWRKKIFPPLALPIYCFAVAILLGAGMLCLPISCTGKTVSFIDALFTATSAACVTGLTVVDTGATFTRFGQTVILMLIQLGGLGIMTFSSLLFFLWRRRISLTDHIAVGQSLLKDPTFHLGRFLTSMVATTFVIESTGALALFLFDPTGFSPYSAVFHAISAFCNAGFGLFPDNLVGYVGHAGVNLVIVWLIVAGGLGFHVLIECYSVGRERLFKRSGHAAKPRLSWYTKIVLNTSLFLIVAGLVLIWFAEFTSGRYTLNLFEQFLAALFQSVTCRTAGFNTLDIGRMGDASLAIMVVLMFIGGSPGSCAGGIKTTTFRALLAFSKAEMLGRKQAVIGKFALDAGTVNRALTLTIFAAALVFCSTLIMCFSEGATSPGAVAHIRFLEILFEVVSAFGTVGLSTGITPSLTMTGKLLITALMFIGRLGPILFLSFLQGFQEPLRFKWSEKSMLIG